MSVWRYYFFLCAFILVACDDGLLNKFQKKNCIIQYKNECLTQYELKSITQNANKQDSEYISKKYIDEWLLEQVLFEKAKATTQIDKEELESRLSKIKKQYYISSYLQNYIQENLDTSVSDKEILKYYESHKEAFKLSSNIVQIYYVKLNDDEKEILEFKKLLSSNKDHSKLNSFIFAKANSYFIEDSLWLKWDDVTKEIPVLKNYSLNSFTKGKIIEWRNGTYYYYVKIKDYKEKNEFSPLAYEKEKIKAIIIEQRKQSLIKDLKAQVLTETEVK